MFDELKIIIFDFWKGFWKDGNIGWYCNEVNEFLIKYFDEFIGG